MFAFKFATILAVTAAAIAVPTPGGSGSCSTGSMQCCDSIAPANSTSNAGLDGIIPIGILGTNTPIGFNCLPISVIGLGSAGTCNSQTACCSDINNEGVVPIGLDCSPVNAGL